jgi:hypothetical protein
MHRFGSTHLHSLAQQAPQLDASPQLRALAQLEPLGQQDGACLAGRLHILHVCQVSLVAELGAQASFTCKEK